MPVLVLLLCISAAIVSIVLCQPSDSSYQLVWSEEFDYPSGAQPSSATWNWDGGAGGWGSEQLQFYTPRTANSYTNDSALVIQANYESYYGSPYTSARLNTLGKVAVYQGYVAARVRIGMANGFWPAVSMLGSTSESLGWPYCGEVDFMEQVNGMSAGNNSNDHTQYGTAHYNAAGIDGARPGYTAAQQGGSINTSSATVLWGDDWHVYAFEWTATALTFSVDSTTYATVCTTCTTGTNSFTNASNPFYFVVALAMGGSMPNEVPAEASLPGMLLVDWIRVWQKDDEVSYISAAAGGSGSSSSASSASASSSSPTSSHPLSSSLPSSSSAASSTSSPASSSTRPPSSSSSSSSSASTDQSFTLGDWSPPDPSYSLVWHEEFSYTDGTQPSAAVWNWETGGNGWGNDELEYYTPRTVNSYVSDDTLIVAGLWESYGGLSITSARLTTESKVEVYRGVVAARVRVQGMQNGFWPAVWMLGNKSDTINWPYCGEVDFMEQVNGMSAPGTPSDDHYQHGSIHYNVGGESSYPNLNAAQQTSVIATANASTLWGDDWHVYAFEWTATTLSFIVDSTTYSTFDITSADYDMFRDATNPFYFVIDLAFGGDFPDVSPVQSAFPAHMEVDWLRVWQHSDGSSYVNAATGSLVTSGGSSSATVASSSSSSSNPLTAFSSESSSGSPLAGSASSSGSLTVHTSGASLSADSSVWRVWLVTLLLLSSVVFVWR